MNGIIRGVLRYLRELTTARFVLWCYLIWWLSVARAYFDPSPLLWLNSLGISAIIGTGLLLSTAYGGTVRVPIGGWAVARLYMMPFFVSSFAALIKERGFVLVFFPTWQANLVPLVQCALLAVAWRIARRQRSTKPFATVRDRKEEVCDFRGAREEP